MEQYVFTYDRLEDPPAHEVDALVKSLKGSKILDRMPGSILVQSSATKAKAVRTRFPNWKLQPMGTASATPPNRKLRKTL